MMTSAPTTQAIFVRVDLFFDSIGSMNGQKIIPTTNKPEVRIPMFNGASLRKRYVGKKYHSGFMCVGVMDGSAGAPNPGG